jgi:hypothetical protein
MVTQRTSSASNCLMKIAFLCRSLEPGRDGVGDYTRRLAGELIRQGHLAVIVALNDPYISETVFDQQEIEGTSISVQRLPDVLPWSKRIVAARDWLDDFSPDWISLQFVPFGFHRKGLCFGLGKMLAAMNRTASWHIMFHELWLGLGKKSSLKHRVVGALQRLIILDLMERLRPRTVHTQTESYRIALIREKIQSSILPLFGNIPQINGDGWDGLLEPLVAKAMGKRPDRNRLYLAGVLGMVYAEWNPEQTVNTLLPLVQSSQKRLVLVFHGKNNLTPEAFNKLKLTLQNRADVVVAGERTSFEISKILQALDLGLATTPRQMIQKSGSVAAMLEHGLQVLVTRDDWHLRGSDSPLEEMSDRLLSPEQFSLLKTLPTREFHSSEDRSVKRIAGQMLKPMKLPLPAHVLTT